VEVLLIGYQNERPNRIHHRTIWAKYQINPCNDRHGERHRRNKQSR
jgi:hypothetical protein